MVQIPSAVKFNIPLQSNCIHKFHIHSANIILPLVGEGRYGLLILFPLKSVDLEIFFFILRETDAVLASSFGFLALEWSWLRSHHFSSQLACS